MKQLLIILLLGLAAAAPTERGDGAISEWFQGLRQPKNNSSCCSIADCQRVTTRYSLVGIEVWDKTITAWLPVPEDTIIATANPTGEAVACIYSGRVLCFIRGLET